MAIDKNKTKELVNEINHLFEIVTGPLPSEAKEFVRTAVMGPVFEEIRTLIDESRSPVLFLVGRSGHGKSSLINALANKQVADVGDVKPTTPESIPYEILFNERYSTWSVIDTRGIFETTKPDGALSDDAVKVLERDILKYKPDIIMHVVSAPEIRNLANDLMVFKQITTKLKNETGTTVPTIVVLNRIDTLGNPRQWPPEESPQKAGLIKDALDYMTQDVLKTRESRGIDLNFPIKGYKTNDDTYLGIIPVCSLDEDLWNIETLSEFIGEQLPKEALLGFFQAQKRKDQLKKLSSSLIYRFATISGGIGASPIPISDIIVLTPLQLLLISIIGGLSCREFSKDTAGEFFAAAGLNLGAAVGLRFAAQQLLKLIPVVGWAGAGAMAAAGTYSIGKSAEAYFFSGEIKKPEEFINEWRNAN